MRTPRFPRADRRLLLPLVFSMLLALPACSVNVKNDEAGHDKRVDIETPMGGIHVSKDADVRDVGLPVYPGARPKAQAGDGNENNARVTLSSGLFGLRVAAIEYVSDDPPDKLVAYYKDQLKKYGSVLECHTDTQVDVDPDPDPDKDSPASQELKCEGNGRGRTIELKAGTQRSQHIVSIQPGKSGRGTDFGLVYLQLRGGKDTI